MSAIFEKINIDEAGAKDSFISSYSPEYFLKGETESLYLIRKCLRTSPWVEKEILGIMDEDSISGLNFFRIFAWKNGCINHTKSERDKHFQYKGKWNECKMRGSNRRASEWSLEALCCKLAADEEQKELRQLISEGKIQTALDEIQKVVTKTSTSGIGSVQKLNLVFFLSRGTYPIYDRFSKVAIDALCSGKNPEEITYTQPPTSHHDLASLIEEYIEQLSQLFGDQWKRQTAKTDNADHRWRDIDRALWVYGHRKLNW